MSFPKISRYSFYGGQKYKYFEGRSFYLGIFLLLELKFNITMNILDKKALTFLENYLNNAAPTGYESGGTENMDGIS